MIPATRSRGRPLRERCAGLRAQAWWVIRKRGRFTLPDLLLTLATAEHRNPEDNLKKYLARLVKVGVLEVAKERVPDGKLTSNGLYAYRLAKDLGPQAPIVRWRGNKVFDPNSQRELEPLQAQPQQEGGT